MYAAALLHTSRRVLRRRPLTMDSSFRLFFSPGRDGVQKRVGTAARVKPLADIDREGVDGLFRWEWVALRTVNVKLRTQPKSNSASPIVRVLAAVLHDDRQHLCDAVTPQRIVKLRFAVVIKPPKSQITQSR